MWCNASWAIQILKNNAVKVLHSICQQTGKLSSGHRIGKGQFSFQSQRKAMPNNVQIILKWHSFHMIQRLCSKSSKIIFSSTWTENFQIFRLDSKKADDQIANIHWITEKAREFQKKIYFCPIDSTKAFDCGDHNHLWNILKEMGIPDQFSCLQRNLHAGQEATVEQDVEQRNAIGSKLGREYFKAGYCHPAYLNYLQSTSYEVLAGWLTRCN